MIDQGYRANLVAHLLNGLFKKELDRLHKRELELVSENRSLSGGKFDGFFYQGRYYTDLDRTVASKGLKSGVHSSLVPLMEKHVADVKEVDFDRLRVKQALAMVLKDTRTRQDVRDALPNQLIEFIPEIQSLERTRPEGYTLMANPRQRKQYEKLREKIEFYTATRLLY